MAVAQLVLMSHLAALPHAVCCLIKWVEEGREDLMGARDGLSLWKLLQLYVHCFQSGIRKRSGASVILFGVIISCQ